MRIIDLLNKIANGEEVPKKIKWEDTIYVYSDYDKDYLEFPFSEEEYQGLFCMKDSILTQFLNDKVEILEEKKAHTLNDIRESYGLPRIEKKKIPENNFNYIYSCEDEHIMANFENIKTTLKDIIDYLKSKGE